MESYYQHMKTTFIHVILAPLLHWRTFGKLPRAHSCLLVGQLGLGVFKNSLEYTGKSLKDALLDVYVNDTSPNYALQNQLKEEGYHWKYLMISLGGPGKAKAAEFKSKGLIGHSKYEFVQPMQEWLMKEGRALDPKVEWLEALPPESGLIEVPPEPEPKQPAK